MSKATENDDNDEGLTINITRDNAEEAFGEFAEKRKGNPRKRVVQRGQKKWMGGKQKRIDFELKDAKNGKRNGNKTGDDSDFERKRKSFLNDQNERESSGRGKILNENVEFGISGTGGSVKADDEDGKNERKAGNGERVAKMIEGKSVWVKKPTSSASVQTKKTMMKRKRTNDEGDEDGDGENLSAKEMFLKKSREHKEKLEEMKKKRNSEASEEGDDYYADKKKKKTNEDDDDDDDDEAFNPADWANLMKKATKKTEKDQDDDRKGGAASRGERKDDAPHRDRVFDSNTLTAKSFSELGVPDTLTKIMSESADLQFTEPTLVQQLAMPSILAGKDCYVRAETGSGKTLAYVLPIVISLGTAKPRVDRNDGTRALIIVPTRELSTQVSSFVEKLSKPYHWISSGSIHGGENRAKEKAKLRKGCVILSATPGRLLDHLQNTEAFVFVNCSFLVFDEADRVLDLGFEKDVDAILDIIEDTKKDAKSAPFQMTLLSATLTPGTDRLRMKMQNAVTVDVNPEADREIEFVQRDDDDDDNENDEDEEGLRRAMARAAGTVDDTNKQPQHEKKIRVPAQLTHTIFETPPKARLAAIAGLLAGWALSDLNKVIVFFASRESVEYHYEILSWLAGQKNKKNSSSSDDDDDDDDDDSENEDDNKKDSSMLYEVFRLHGAQKQADRQKVVSRFQSQKRGVLLCTDVGARGLDFENVGATVQVDPPADAKTYAHRVGRAARLGNDGEAVLFLAPKELEYEDVLKESIEDLSFAKANLGAVLNVLAKTTMQKYCERQQKGTQQQQQRYSQNNPTEHIAVKALMHAAEKKMRSDPGLKSRAEDAFRSHVRAVAAYPSALKHIFHVKRLHLGHVAGAFALREAPTLVGKKGSDSFSNAKKLDKVTTMRKKREKDSQLRKKRTSKKIAQKPATRNRLVGAL